MTDLHLHRPGRATTAAESSAGAVGGIALLLVAAVVAVFLPGVSAPFAFDDTISIVENRTIRRLSTALSPPTNGSATMGRPVVNVSFALNYALGRLDVRGYHAVNIALHAASTLLLFGIVRRTLLRCPPPGSAREAGGGAPSPAAATATRLGFAATLLWAVHPLLTISVTAVAQRTELLAGFFLLLTLYSFIRHADAPGQLRWFALAVIACLFGMGSKEAMVVAPVLVLLYDRTFVAGSFRGAWRERHALHLGLAATWLFLAVLLAGSGGTRGTAAGFGLGVTSWSYALTQSEAIVRYLGLAVWPHPLVYDYGTDLVADVRAVLPQLLVVAGLVAGTLFALWRRPALGFAGAWFFIILAPSSSVVPLVTQTMGEHRMYLPLAAVVVLVVLGWHALVRRAGVLVAVSVALGLGATAIARNAVYRSELALWTDTVAKRPQNPRALNYLGAALAQAGRPDEAERALRQSIRLDPRPGEPYANLGNVLYLRGRATDALAMYETALQINPALARARGNLALILLEVGRGPEAIAQAELAVQHDDENVEARQNLALALLRAGRHAEAIVQLEHALRLRPGFADAHNTLGVALASTGRREAAMRHFEEALRLNPRLVTARENVRQLRALQQRGSEP
jgi:protein O-mannosyl-transferase